eukprot:216263-Rhodomonas_salina.4
MMQARKLDREQEAGVYTPSAGSPGLKARPEDPASDTNSYLTTLLPTPSLISEPSQSPTTSTNSYLGTPHRIESPSSALPHIPRAASRRLSRSGDPI